MGEPKDANFKYLKTLNEFRQNFLRAIKMTEQRKAKLLEIEKRKKWKQNKSNDVVIDLNKGIQQNNDNNNINTIKTRKRNGKQDDEKRRSSIDLDDIDDDEQQRKIVEQNRKSAKLRRQ